MDAFCLTCIAGISRSSFRAVTRAEKLAPQATFCLEPFENHDTLFMVFTRWWWWWGGDTPLFGLVRGCAAAQGMGFDLSVLNMAYNFVRVCPRQGI